MKVFSSSLFKEKIPLDNGSPIELRFKSSKIEAKEVFTFPINSSLSSLTDLLSFEVS
jgi:hypothetical protein